MTRLLTTMARLGKVGGLALAAIVVGAVLIGIAVAAQKSAPTPPASAAGTLDAAPSSTAKSASSRPSAGPTSLAPSSAAPSASASSAEPPLGPSKPVSISIPAIDVKSAVFAIGKDDDGTLKVPQPGPNLNKVAWFEKSPTPGQPGPAVLEGHVDSVQGPSVFFELGDVRPGNKIIIKRHDGRTVTFTVNAVRDYQKDAFPTRDVYGSGDLSKSEIRLITCSDFDKSIRHHVGNLIVFAHLTSVQGKS